MRISHLRHNVELKARDPDPARSESVCARLAAEDKGVLEQRDTYFHVRSGRLKLREEAGSAAHLIAYARENFGGERESSYRIVETGQPDALKQALAETLGIAVVVSKHRRLFLWENVRIHLDRVDGLGAFLEFEAVAEPGSNLERETAQVTTLRDAFGVADEDLIAESYCDLQASKI